MLAQTSIVNHVRKGQIDKSKDKKWAEDHLIIEIEGLSKKEKDELRDRIMEKVSKKFGKAKNDKKQS